MAERRRKINNLTRGRAVQAKVAAMAGARNTGTLGMEDAWKPGKYSIEVKSRVKSSAKKFMDQAVTNCQKGTIPVVVLHINGTRYLDDIVMIRLRDFKKLDPEWAPEGGCGDE